MHTTGTPEILGNRARIARSGTDGTIHFLYAHIIEPPTAQFTAGDATPSGPAGQNPNEGICKLLITFTNPLMPLRLIVALTPEDTKEDLRLSVELTLPLNVSK